MSISSNDSHSKESEKIVTEELTQIRVRRAAVGVSADNSTKDKPIDTCPVGVALSGGGIRSGSTAIGFLQSLYAKGLLRSVDYLSTVSGGTYAGAFLASQTAAAVHESQTKSQSPTVTKINLTPHLPCDNPVVLDMHPKGARAQTREIRTLALAGERWKRPLRFLQQHLPGFLLVNLFVLSACVMVAALAALLFRMLDLPEASRYLVVMGFDTDLSRAFFPAFVTLILWVICFLFRRYRPIAAAGAWIYGFLIASIAMGTVSLFSTANLDLSSMERNLGWTPEVSNRIRGTINWLGQIATIFAGFAIVPLISPQAVLRSGKSTNQMTRWVFNALSGLCLMGIPLLVFYYLSMEGISIKAQPGKNEPAMTRSHIANWTSLAGVLRADRESNNSSRTDKVAQQLQLTAVIPSSQGDAYRAGSAGTNAMPGVSLDQTNQADPVPTSQLGGSPLTAATPPPDEKMPITTLLERNTSHERSPGKYVWLLRQYMSQNLYAKLEKKSETDNEESGNRVSATNCRLSESLAAEPNDDGSFLVKMLSFPLELLRHHRSGKQIVSDDKTLSKDEFNQLDPITQRQLQSQRQANLAKLIDEEIGSAKFASNLLSNLGNEARKNDQILQRFNDLFELELTAQPVVDDPLLRAYTVDQPIPNALIKDEYRPVLLLKLLRNADALDNHSERVASSAERLNNWNLLRVLYGPRVFESPREIFASNVAYPDLKTRATYFSLASLLTFVLGFFSVNLTTMQTYYRDQLAESWIPYATAKRQLKLADAMPPSSGVPLLLINATVNLHGYPFDGALSRTERFTLSPLFVGNERLGCCKTKDYAAGDYSLADATAISAAAVSPVAEGNILSRALLVVLNFRLGQWLPHPGQNMNDRPTLDYPVPLCLLKDHFTKPAHHRSFLFVTDGGHNENTGIEPLLVRRCRVIIAADFSEDPNYEFADFRQLCLRARETLGVTLRQDSRYPLEDLVPDDKTAIVKRHLALFRIQYSGKTDKATQDSNADSGWLILLKPGLSGDEQAGLRECRRNFAKFPHDPTGDQMFDEVRFMAYRQLGEHLGDSLGDFFGGGSLPNSSIGYAQGEHRHPPFPWDDPLWLSQLWEPRPADQVASHPTPPTKSTPAAEEVVAKVSASSRSKPR